MGKRLVSGQFGDGHSGCFGFYFFEMRKCKYIDMSCAFSCSHSPGSTTSSDLFTTADIT